MNFAAFKGRLLLAHEESNDVYNLKQILTSSAYNKYGTTRSSVKSLMNSPQIEPWGTPIFTLNSFEIKLESSTYCVLLP